MELILGIAFFALIIYYFFIQKKAKKVGKIQGGHNHYFDKLQFSSDEFYSLVEKIVAERQMPDTKIMRTNYHEASILSPKREYLRVERKDDIFDICAAPFGTGFFVSYWMGKAKHTLRDFFLKIIYGGTSSEEILGTTYYKEDTASMFRASVVDSIMEAIGQITTTKGIRGFSEAERIAFGK